MIFHSKTFVRIKMNVKLKSISTLGYKGISYREIFGDKKHKNGKNSLLTDKLKLEPKK